MWLKIEKDFISCKLNDWFNSSFILFCFQMVGPKPKPVRPLTASKNGFEKPTDTKKVKKTKGKTPRGTSVGKKMEKKFMEMEGDFKTSSKSEIKNSGKTVYLEPDKVFHVEFASQF